MSVCLVFAIALWLLAAILIQVDGAAGFAEELVNGFIDDIAVFLEDGKLPLLAVGNPFVLEVVGDRLPVVEDEDVDDEVAPPVGPVLLLDESVLLNGFRLGNFHPSSARTKRHGVPKNV